MRTLSHSSKDRWLIVSMIVLTIVLSSIGYSYTIRQTGSEEKPIETSTIDTGDIILSATGPGILVPGEEVSFGFKNGGQVAEVLVSFGETVQAGQVLARLESSTIALTYAQVEANLAALASRATVAEAEQTVQDAKASFDTARDDLQFLIGPDMLVAEEKIAHAQDELKAAKAAAEKGPSDANEQRVSEAELALAKAQETLNYAFYTYSSSYIQQTFTYPIRNEKGVTIRRELLAPTEAELLAARAAYELARANLEDAQNYLDVLKGNKTSDEVPASSVTSLAEAKIAFDQAKANLDATELNAPISGTITSISLHVGETVGTSAVITLSNLDQPYTIDAYLDETDWDKARVGYAATVTFDLLPDEDYPAKVTRVYPILDNSSGTSMVHVVVQLNDSIDADLPAGSTASVDIAGGEALDAVLVPVSVLKETEAGKYVVYVMQNGEFIEQEVEIGLQDLLYAEVKAGLKNGDVVLTNGTVNP